MNENEIVVQKEEFRRIIKVFAEHHALGEIVQNYKDRIEVLQRLMGDKDSVIVRQRENINILEEEKELLKPAWYDNFTIGCIAGILIGGLLGFLIGAAN